MIQVVQNGTLRNANDGRMMQGGVLRRVRSVQVMRDGVLLTAYSSAPALAASVSPADVYGSSRNQTVTTSSATASPAGGQGPFSYQWSVLYSDRPVSINGARSATASFTMTGVIAGEQMSAALGVVVTDSLGQAATAQVNATFTRTSAGGAAQQ